MPYHTKDRVAETGKEMDMLSAACGLKHHPTPMHASRLLDRNRTVSSPQGRTNVGLAQTLREYSHDREPLASPSLRSIATVC